MFSKSRLMNVVIWLTIICVVSFGIGISMVIANVGNMANLSFGPENVKLDVFGEKSAGTIEGVNEISINAGSLGVEILPGETDEISAKLSGSIRGKKVDKDITFDVNRSGGTVNIVADIRVYITFGFSYAKLQVFVPEAYANKINVNCSSGSVTINSYKLSEAVLHASSGSIKANNLTANVMDVQSSSGSVNLNDVTASQLTARSQSGSLNLKNMSVSKSIDALASSGSLNVSFKDFSGKANLNAHSGSCSVDFPDNAGLKITASTSSGSVKCSLPFDGQHNSHFISGTVNGGENTVVITTSSGSIRIE